MEDIGTQSESAIMNHWIRTAWNSHNGVNVCPSCGMPDVEMSVAILAMMLPHVA